MRKSSREMHEACVAPTALRTQVKNSRRPCFAEATAGVPNASATNCQCPALPGLTTTVTLLRRASAKGAKAQEQNRRISRSAEALLPPHECGGSHRLLGTVPPTSGVKTPEAGTLIGTAEAVP